METIKCSNRVTTHGRPDAELRSAEYELFQSSNVADGSHISVTPIVNKLLDRKLENGRKASIHSTSFLVASASRREVLGGMSLASMAAVLSTTAATPKSPPPNEGT